MNGLNKEECRFHWNIQDVVVDDDDDDYVDGDIIKTRQFYECDVVVFFSSCVHIL